MTKSLFNLILSLVALLLTINMQAIAQQSNKAKKNEAPKMVFDGIEQFWETVSILEQDRNPSTSDWNALFSSPGYRHYFADSKEEADSFQQLMELVFMPSSEAALQDTLESVEGEFDFDLRPFYALLAAKESQEELKQFQKKLSESNMPQEAAKAAARLLPEGTEADVPPFLFNIYKLDGTGTPDYIIMDLVAAKRQGQKGARLTFAHEVHHAVIDRISNLDIPEKGKDPRYYLLLALNKLQKEGIADRIDKQYFFSGDMRNRLEKDSTTTGIWLRTFIIEYYAKQFKKVYEATPQTLQSIDSLITMAAQADAAGDETKLAEISEAVIRSLPINAHPNGYFMANLITEKLGEEALVKNVANPFAFIRLYNKAVKQKDIGHEPFSQEAMSYLKKLERKYIKLTQN